MEILEFLFSNIFFLIAILWFVSSIFGRKRKEEQQRNKNPRPVAFPTEERNPDPVASPVELDKPWEKVEQEELQRNEGVRPRNQDLVRRAEWIESKEIGSEAIGKLPVDTVIATEPVRYSKRSKQLLDFTNLNRTKVVQGMVWSQVFGLPRAKEPHRTSPYTKYSRRS